MTTQMTCMTTSDVPPLHGYQEKAIEFSLSKAFSYQALDMGLGKTRIALECIRRLQAPTLVIAPLRAVKTTWPDEIEKWAPELTYNVLHGLDKSFKPKANIYIINFDGIAWLFDELKRIFSKTKVLPFRFMVLDEGSMVKSHRSKRFEALKHIRHVCNLGIMILSGTPAPNFLLDLWPQYYLLDGGKRLGKNITAYRTSYFKQKPYCKFAWEIMSEDHADAIHRRVSDITYRLEAGDYLELPERIDNIVSIKLSDKVIATVKEFEKNLVLKLNETTTVTAPFAAALTNKLRQIIQGGLYTGEEISGKAREYEVIHTEKVDALKSLVQAANGQGILCAIQFKFELDMLRKEFPDAPAVVGKSNIKDFKRICDTWNAGDIPLLFCHPASLSHSVNLQYGSHLLVWYALPWSLEHYLQLNARLHRQGQKSVCIFHHLVAKGTVDERVLQALQLKLKGQNALLDYLKKTTGEYDAQQK